MLIAASCTPWGEVAMRTWKVALANSGASLGREEFNILEFFPDPPDEMG